MTSNDLEDESVSEKLICFNALKLLTLSGVASKKLTESFTKPNRSEDALVDTLLDFFGKDSAAIRKEMNAIYPARLEEVREILSSEM